MAGCKAKMFDNPINQIFEKLVAQLNQPDWLLQKRKSALKIFQKYGLPTRKSELWKYTDVTRLERSGLSAKDDVVTDAMLITTELGEISVTDLADMNQSDWQDLKIDNERVFVALNTAMLNSAKVITIAKNKQVKIHIHYNQIDQNWHNLRTFINIEENAQLQLTESYDSDCRITHVSIINADNNATIKLQSNKLLSKTATLIHYTQINCAQGVNIEQMNINNNGLLSHSIQDVNFFGEDSCFKAASVNLSKDSSHIAENILVNHLFKNCKSEIIRRSLAQSKGQIALNAKAVVDKGADGSDIAQSLKNILLSDDAKIYSRPELEINTDDVIAAHGSTTGELDDQALTYLRSRGIPKEQAELMLIESFLQDANIFSHDNFLDTIKL